MSGNDIDGNPIRFSRRAFIRTFVHLDKRVKAAPSKREFDKLKNAGRVKVIAFTKNHTAGEIDQLIVSHFPTLVGLDLSRLRIISSYNRGHSMSVVHRGVPDGNEIMQKFGGDAKKKIFLYLKRGTSSSNPPTDNMPSSAAPDLSSSSLSTSSLTSTLSSTTSSSTTTSLTCPPSITPSSSASASLSTGIQLSTQVSSAPSLSLPATATNATGGIININDNTPLLTTSDMHTNTVMVTSTPVTTAQNWLPRNGRETRRYLTALAQTSNRDGSAQLSIPVDDDGDDELLQSPFDDITVIDPPPQTRRQRRFNTATRTSTTTRTVNVVTQSTVGFYGTPFCGDGIRAGAVEEHLLPIGLDVTSSFDSRTDEVSRCESLLRASCTNDDTSLLPFLNHTFEEVCWQAYDNKRAIVVVLLNPTGQSQYRESMLRFLRKVQAESSNEDWFYWAAETSSKNGQKVLTMYGNGQEDQIIFLAPATQKNPVFVERMEGDSILSQLVNESCGPPK